MTPHTLRHSVVYPMLNRDRGNTLYDITKRLRHATIQSLNECILISIVYSC